MGMPPTKAILLDAATREREALSAMLAGLTREQLLWRGAYGWSVKDHVAHLANGNACSSPGMTPDGGESRRPFRARVTPGRRSAIGTSAFSTSTATPSSSTSWPTGTTRRGA